MKNIFLAVIATMLVACSAHAQSYTGAQSRERLARLGMSPELTTEIVAQITGTAIYPLTRGVTNTVGTLAALGSTQGNAAVITDRVTAVSAADATKGVVLPATPATGGVYEVINTAAAVLKIYPGTGDTINATAANTAVEVAASVVTYCRAISAAAWWCSEGTAP